MSKKALITGVSGQTGSYMANYLLEKGYEVYGLVRRIASRNNDYIKKWNLEQVKIIEGDITDASGIHNIVKEHQFDEIYNFAAQSHVGHSFKNPESTVVMTGLAPLYFLEAIRLHSPKTRFYTAGSSEMLGNSPPPQGINTPFNPQSPYAAAKLMVHNLVEIYRKAYGIFAVSAICFNHESERRSVDFVTRKVTDWIGKNYIALSNKESVNFLSMGNLDARRDWSYAPDIVEGIWMMMQRDSAQDFVLGSGQSHSIRDFITEAFRVLNIELVSNTNGFEMYLGKEQENDDILWSVQVIRIDPSFYRPAEVNYLEANIEHTRKVLGWSPKTSFKELVAKMVHHDIKKHNCFWSKTLDNPTNEAYYDQSVESVNQGA